MPDQTVFEELKDVLTELKEFLDDNIGLIRPAIQQIVDLIPTVGELITQLSQLLGELRTAIADIDLADLPGLSEITGFVGLVPGLLGAARGLLGDSEAIANVERVAGVVTGLPSLDEVKTELLSLLDAVVTHVDSLRS